MIRTKRRIWLCSVLIFAILAFIWGNSLMPARISQAFSDFVAWLLLGTEPVNGEMAEGSGILRKLAHFTEFAALGMSLAWLFGMLQKGRLLPFACGVAAACMDETIQLFVPERGPGLRDVCIDSCGVLAGIVLLHLGHTYLKKRSTQSNLEDM